MRAARAALLASYAMLFVTGVSLGEGCIPTLSQPRGEAHLEALARGNRLHADDDYDGAARAYAEAARSAERRVDRDEALYRESRSLIRANREAEAVAVLDEIAAREPTSRNTVRALYDASRLRLELGERDRALADLTRLVREHPNHGNAPRALGILTAAASEADAEGASGGGRRLLESLDPVVAESELHDDLLFRLAELVLEDGDRATARAVFERLVAEHPFPQGDRWDEALMRLADLDEEDGDAAAAIVHLEALTLRHEGTWSPGSYTRSTMPRAQLRIARLERDGRGDLDAAASAYRRLYDDYPMSTLRDDALLELGDLEWRRDRREAACALFRRVVEEFEVGGARREAERRLGSECQSSSSSLSP